MKKTIVAVICFVVVSFAIQHTQAQVVSIEDGIMADSKRKCETRGRDCPL